MSDNLSDCIYFSNYGEVLYFNPQLGKICDDYKLENSLNANKQGCMKFYYIGENNGKYSFLLDHNTTATINGNLSESIQKDTSTWQVPARSLKTEELGKILRKSIIGNNIKNCFNSETTTCPELEQGASEYYWLYDYTRDCTKYGCKISDSSAYGYWMTDQNNNIWNVDCMGYVNQQKNYFSNFHGVRPVIELNLVHLLAKF